MISRASILISFLVYSLGNSNFLCAMSDQSETMASKRYVAGEEIRNLK